MAEALVERVRAMRAEQALPPAVEDPRQINQLAGLLAGKETPPCK